MTKSTQFIPEVFIKLTKNTYPYGTENIISDKMYKLGLFPEGVDMDEHGNYFCKIGESRTIFACHLDTVSKVHEPVTHVIDGFKIKTDGTTTLGADDKAGVTILVWMMKNKIPGLYYFFIGEECGCIGSSAAANSGDFKEYDRIISFDRRGTTSIITHQSWSRCCSDVFADAFCDELNKSGLSYVKDDSGVYTDSAEFVDLIPECTNVSVGYYKEHTFDENQDIEHLVKLADACLKVDWENLPTKREPNVYEPKSYKKTGYGVFGSRFDYWDEEDTEWDGSKTVGNYPVTSTSWSRTTGVRKTRDYNYYEDWLDEEDEDGNFNHYHREEDFFETKKSKRGSKKSKTYFDKGGNLTEIKTKSYFDKGGNFIEIKTTKETTKRSKEYDWVINKFSSNKLTQKELEIVREQYLDMDDDYDRHFYENLIDELLGDDYTLFT
jgi:hypothetical protein